MRDRVDRPQPSLDPVEGDEETIEEDLRRKEQERSKQTKKKTA